MNASNPIQTKAEWTKYRDQLTTRNRWVRSTAEPDSYPVICVDNNEYDHRYNQYYTIYEFVYLEDFIQHDDQLLAVLSIRHRREQEKYDLCEHEVWCGNWCELCHDEYRKAATDDSRTN